METRDQRFAASAYEMVKSVPKEQRVKYGSMAHKLPVLIRTAGLAQALAFVEARGQEPHKLLLDHLAATMGQGKGADLSERSRKAYLPEYMRLTHEAIAALLWYKRFVQSVLDVGADDEGGGQ
jgi:CRISPR-associated protein Cmr5